MKDRSSKVVRALDVLRSDLASRPDELRAYALGLVNEIGQGSGSLWYEIGMVGGQPLPVRWRTVGPTRVSLSPWLDEAIPWPNGDPRLPPKHWDRVFLLLKSVVGDIERQLFSSRVYERVWLPAGMQDQLRMVVFHRGEHVAWLGCLRHQGESKFTRADQRRLAPLADALADALITARAVERARAPEEGCDLLLSAQGRVMYASGEGKRWLARHRDTPRRLRAWARAIERRDAPPSHLHASRIRWSRMHGSGQPLYLLHVDEPPPVRLHPSHVLSRTQRHVASLAAAGATATEIAAMSMLTPGTVRGYMKQIYELLEIGSRAELARVFADLPSDAAEQELSAPRRPGRRRRSR